MIYEVIDSSTRISGVERTTGALGSLSPSAVQRRRVWQWRIRITLQVHANLLSEHIRGEIRDVNRMPALLVECVRRRHYTPASVVVGISNTGSGSGTRIRERCGEPVEERLRLQRPADMIDGGAWIHNCISPVRMLLALDTRDSHDRRGHGCRCPG